jgi:hypothetical protein
VKSSGADDMDVGHKPEHQFAPRQQQAIANKEDPADFKEDQATLSHYRAEHPSCNRSHKGEKVEDDE